jgi:hypothetical protein
MRGNCLLGGSHSIARNPGVDLRRIDGFGRFDWAMIFTRNSGAYHSSIKIVFMIFSFVAGSLGKSLDFDENGFLARGSDDAETGLSFDEINQGWNGLNFVIKTEIKTIVRVNLHDLDFSCEVAR